MMRLLLLPAVSCFSLGLAAHNPDTVNVKKIALEEVTIVGFKQDPQNRAPLSVTSLNSRFLRNNEITSARDLSALLPNFYMPDYGSRQNSPVYIRGIGSKTNTPTVVFYVDGVPHFERSAFDIDLSDISSVEVLRGPQGTLYGRNSIGGIINVYTHSPLEYQNTRLKLSYGSRNDVKLTASNYTKVNDTFGFSVMGNYHHNDGFFTNQYTGRKADDMNSATGRVGLEWKPSTRWAFRLNTSLDYSDQGGYPYGAFDVESGKVSPVNYDGYSMYRRLLFTAGLNLRYEGDKFSLNSQTSYQYLRDKQGIDQDFTPKPQLYVEPRLKQNMYSQEFTIKSRQENRYRWITGLFAFYQGIDHRVETSFLEKGYSTPKFYDIPTTGIALYHQSSYDIWRGLSATLGLRYDYEHARDRYTAFKKPLEGAGEPKQTDEFTSRLNFRQLTPKFTLQYSFPGDRLVYAAVSRGYKAGGFNTTFRKEHDEERTYKPEYNWNYEIGAKAGMLDNRLTAELSLFYIDWRDQQVAQTVPGMGNIQRNAGHSESKGLELSVQMNLLRNLSLQTNYGYTYARFLDYTRDEKTNYSHKFLPMVPKHTLSVNADYTLYRVCRAIDRFTVSGNLTGVGPIYWNEDNAVRQDFYMQLQAKIIASKGRFTWELWGKNLTDTYYMSYYFVARGKFAQRGKPFMVGGSFIVDL